MDEIKGAMYTFISEISIGFQKLTSANDAAVELQHNLNDFKDVNTKTFISFLKLVKAAAFTTASVTKRGKKLTSLKYKKTSVADAEDVAKKIGSKIGTYFNIDDEIVSIETNDDDGSLTIITKGGVRHHYDGKEVEKLYSSQHRFDEIVQSLKG